MILDLSHTRGILLYLLFWTATCWKQLIYPYALISLQQISYCSTTIESITALSTLSLQTATITGFGNLAPKNIGGRMFHHDSKILDGKSKFPQMLYGGYLPPKEWHQQSSVQNFTDGNYIAVDVASTY